MFASSTNRDRVGWTINVLCHSSLDHMQCKEADHEKVHRMVAVHRRQRSEHSAEHFQSLLPRLSRKHQLQLVVTELNDATD